ncbi:hypothetical protein HM1_0341 [Heliomicrobium modesticaldum Ice1]|uniref:Helix-turn-helix domain-containing protein n=1 Tax=Heliobacterium modesticaldum (strain ATCC 51547 / Ice1) TaxID=498761 RepID=B0TEX7_HELMI|nr:helix-turn-helix domain-containing protein [Heliomicrobium modesticaldum]ABZ82960.1 hypothetical protein HM1_0341 [Heliomicrobium modesticaldum Ice1]
MDDENQKGEWKTLADVSDHLKVPRERVMAWVLAGDLAAVDLDGSGEYRIRQEELTDFLRRQQERTNLAVEKTRRKIEEEAIVLSGLYDWLQQDNASLAALYKTMDDCLLQVIDQFKSQYDNARSSGEISRARAFQDGLLEVYARWEKPKQAYQQWLLSQERRWQVFIAQLGPMMESDGVLLTPADPFLAINMSDSNDDSQGTILENRRRHRDFYQALYLWTKRENNTLREHYERMERCISKMVDAMQDMAKKASKNMEFERGQAFQEASTIIYQQWEHSRSQYNQWLLGFHERWLTCQATVKLELAKYRQQQDE